MPLLAKEASEVQRESGDPSRNGPHGTAPLSVLGGSQGALLARADSGRGRTACGQGWDSSRFVPLVDKIFDFRIPT